MLRARRSVVGRRLLVSLIPHQRHAGLNLATERAELLLEPVDLVLLARDDRAQLLDRAVLKLDPALELRKPGLRVCAHGHERMPSRARAASVPEASNVSRPMRAPRA